jgi:hypothetical protein
MSKVTDEDAPPGSVFFALVAWRPQCQSERTMVRRHQLHATFAPVNRDNLSHANSAQKLHG